MKILVASDHAGIALKEEILPILIELGHEVVDKGPFEYNEADDYPDYVMPVAKEISSHPKEIRAIIFGGSGEGEAMAANRFKGVRATAYYGEPGHLEDGEGRSIIQLSRNHNDSNILCLGSRFLESEEMKKAVIEWLETPFSGDERHVRRIAKLDN